jgi:hypothetical protein
MSNLNKETSVSAQTFITWGHESLDAICAQIPGFESLIIAVGDKATYRWMVSLAKQNLIPQAAKVDLQFVEMELTATNLNSFSQRMEHETFDGALVFCEDQDRDRINLLSAGLSRLPMSIIALYELLPSKWTLYFDTCIEISENSAVIRWRDGRPEMRLPFKGAVSSLPPVIHNQKFRLAVVGEDKNIFARIKSVVPDQLIDVTSHSITDPEVQEASLIFYSDYWNQKRNEDAISLLSKRTTVFVLNDLPLRAEDRILCYRAGARLVFGSAPDNEEILAATMSFLFPNAQLEDPFLRLENEFARRLARIKRDTSWTSPKPSLNATIFS